MVVWIIASLWNLTGTSAAKLQMSAPVRSTRPIWSTSLSLWSSYMDYRCIIIEHGVKKIACLYSNNVLITNKLLVEQVKGANVYKHTRLCTHWYMYMYMHMYMYMYMHVYMYVCWPWNELKQHNSLCSAIIHVPFPLTNIVSYIWWYVQQKWWCSQ